MDAGLLDAPLLEAPLWDRSSIIPSFTRKDVPSNALPVPVHGDCMSAACAGRKRSGRSCWFFVMDVTLYLDVTASESLLRNLCLGVTASESLPRFLCPGFFAQDSLPEQHYLAISVTCAPFNTLNSSLAFPLFTAISSMPALPMYATGSPSGTDPNVRDTDGKMVLPI